MELPRRRYYPNYHNNTNVQYYTVLSDLQNKDTIVSHKNCEENLCDITIIKYY